VFRREAASKVKRMRRSPPPLPELEKPKSLLRLEEGIVLESTSDMNEQLAKVAGLPAGSSVKEKELGGVGATTRVVTFGDGENAHSYVVKSYSDVRSLKWALLAFWAMAARKFSMTPIARLDREYRASRLLRAGGINTPAIVAVAPDERIIVKEFIHGTPLSEIVDGVLRGHDVGLNDVRNFALVLAKAHATKFALGDTKASNAVVSRDGLFLTDLEQAVEGGDIAWDVAEFLYYTAKFFSREESMEKVARAFLDEYATKGDRDVIKKARSPKYLGPFRPFITPGMSNLMRNLMAEYGSA
jgi:tRNA A-37 threonylcarbamoyl transferase component Bud32